MHQVRAWQALRQGMSSESGEIRRILTVVKRASGFSFPLNPLSFPSCRLILSTQSRVLYALFFKNPLLPGSIINDGLRSGNMFGCKNDG